MSQITINGLVKLTPGNTNLALARVEVWDSAGDYGWIASVQTDKQGKFSVIIPEPYAALITATTITITYKVFQNDELLVIDSVSVISDVVNISIKDNTYDDRISDQHIEEIIAYTTITGKITNGKGVVVNNVKVNVYEGGFRDKTLIASTWVNTTGKYNVQIARKTLNNQTAIENKSIHIEVVNNRDVFLVRSTDFFNYEDALDVNLSLAEVTHVSNSEFEDLIIAVNNIIGSEPIISIERDVENNIDEFSFIAQAIDRDVFDIESLVNAYVFSNEIAPTATGDYQHVDFLYVLTKMSRGNVNPAKLYNNERLESIIHSAISDNIIPSHTSGEITTFVEAAKDYHISTLLAEPITKEFFTLNDVFKAIYGNETDAVDLLKLYHSKDYASISEFWSDYKGLYPLLDNVTQKGFKLIKLTGTQPETIAALSVATSSFDNLSEPATWDNTTWQDFVYDVCDDNDKLCVPYFIRGEETDVENTEVKDAYAEYLKQHFHDYYPLKNISAFLGGATGDALISDATIRGKVIDFINDNPEFDLRLLAIHDINHEDYDIDEEDVALVKEELKPFQRLLRVTNGKPEAVIEMKLNGLDSATAIADENEEEFLAAYSAKFGSTATAQAAFSNAVTLFGSAQNFSLGLQLNISYNPSPGPQTNPGNPNPPNPGTPPFSPQVDPNEDPTWTKMFGSLDYCCCDHCMSLYSPAAYFTDMLHFLEEHTPKAYGEFARRRKDLVYLDLTCKNTNTPLPYIDLVNEVLEMEIIGASSPKSFQTRGTAKELASYPEHVYKDEITQVYTSLEENSFYYGFYKNLYDITLANSVYPLSFNYSLQETRTYLQHLGYSRFQLMQLYKHYNPSYNNMGIPDDTEINNYSIAMEFLNLSKNDFTIICGTHPSQNDTWQFYGLPQDLTGNNVIDPADSTLPLTGIWNEVLAGRIDLLLHFCKITYSELLQFLNTEFINPNWISTGRKITIVAHNDASPDTCNTRKLKLKFFDPTTGTNFFKEFHQFMRLWRRNNISIYDLDRILLNETSQFNTGFTSLILYRISLSMQLAKRLKIDVEKLLTWRNPINIVTYYDYNCSDQVANLSPYDRIFRNKAVQNPHSVIFLPNGEVDNTLLIRDHIAEVASVCSTSEDDVTFFLKIMKDAANIQLFAYDSEVNLKNISLVYALSLITKRLGISAKEFYILLKCAKLPGTLTLMGTNIHLATAAFDVLEKLVDFHELLDKSPFSYTELDYLLCNVDERNVLAPDAFNIQLFYEGLRDELRKFNSYEPPLVGPLSDEEVGDVQMLLNTVYQQFSAEFDIPSIWVQTIMEDGGTVNLPTPPTGFIASLIEADFVFPGTTLPPVDSTTYPLLYEKYRLLHKIAMICNKLKFKNDEFVFFYQQPQYIAFDFNSLPDSEANTNIPPLPPLSYGLVRLMTWIEVRDRINLNESDFTSLIINAYADLSVVGSSLQDYKDTWLSIINENTAWDNDWDTPLEILVGTSVGTTATGLLDVRFTELGSIPPSDFSPLDVKGPLMILKIADILDASKRTGLKPESTYSVLLNSLGIEDSNKVLFAAKSKYDENAWFKFAKSLHDPIREEKRRGLVDYVLSHPSSFDHKFWKNENDLYAFFLIDPEMSSCMMTSRIKQGISSVQLFVDRVLMSLEYTTTNLIIAMPPDKIKQWKEWRKWYRIWEANRKIFLYPENWIEPELRDDKSVFFEELEMKLAQEDINDSSVDKAIRNYLAKLDEVSNMEPVGSCDAYDQNLKTIVTHTFARTTSHPQYYYYRRLINDEWTAWERVDLEIKGKHVMPVVWQNRLYIYWLTFQTREMPVYGKKLISQPVNFWFENKQSQTNATITSSGGLVQKYVDITLNWSEYKEGKWLKQCSSKEKAILKLHPNIDEYINLVVNSSDPNMRSFFKILSNDRSFTSSEIVQSRIYLKPFIDSNTDSLYLKLLFPPYFADNTSEHLFYTYGFKFKGYQTDAEILNSNVLVYNIPSVSTYNIPAPGMTIYQNMAFVENPLQIGSWPADKPLVVDTYTTSASSMYNYVEEGFTPITATVRAGSSEILHSTGPNGIFKVIANSNFNVNPLENKFFFYDDRNSYFVRKLKPFQRFSTIVPAVIYHDLDLNNLPSFPGNPFFPNSPLQYFFQTFYHPHVGNFIKKFNDSGIDGLLNIDMQVQDDTMNFVGNYQPTQLVHGDYPKNIVEFTTWGTYSLYNWELFFHIPMLLAQRLSDNQRFDEAQKWYHYIFNPTSNTGLNNQPSINKQRFWKFRWFYDQAGMSIQTLNDLLILINAENYEMHLQIKKWEANPFKPHVVARMRILAYMKNVMMKYLDNLISWADQLFARDTIESINEATNLYILADNILGTKPIGVPKRAQTAPKSFIQIKDILDDFSNAAVEIESYLSPNASPISGGNATGKRPKMFYFCLSPNDKLLKYWDTIADRLYKIRSCRNIDGLVRTLPLFEPPIDPALLVRAAAAGLDINSVLNDVSNASLPNYRFNVMLQKANELCSDVRGLGSMLLSALEKKDAEQLALIRSTQELSLLESIKQMKQLQMDEAKTSLESLIKTKETTEIKYNYYSSRQKYNSFEEAYFRSLKKTNELQVKQANLSATASALALIPQFHGQFVMAVGASYGGQQLSTALNAIAQKIGATATASGYEGNVASTKGSFERRWDDWKFQAQSALKELEQIEKQIVAAEIRIAISEKDLDNQEIEIENNRSTDEYMRSKYTNVQLYNWMITQISTTYFQSYRLAYEVAKKASLCYDYELPLATLKGSEVIQFGYWDSLKKGLLCAEKLQYDLRKLEQAYLDENKRTLELTKHISLATFSASQLQELKTIGMCDIEIPEILYDMDYPGHYNRRVKSVSISIPCVAGPYTTVPCTLTLSNSYVRQEPSSGSTPVDVNSNVSAIATSGAQNDSGMFEFNFRDERYLPFEGAGAISKWNLRLGGANYIDAGSVKTFRPFDFDTIGDVILHVKYTAHDGAGFDDGGTPFEKVRSEAVVDAVEAGYLGNGTDVPLPLLISLKHEFSTEWFAGFSQLVNVDEREFKIPINIDMFPHPFKANGVKLTAIHLYAVTSDKESTAMFDVDLSGAITGSTSLSNSSLPGIVPYYGSPNPVTGTSITESGEITILLSRNTDEPEETEFENFYIILEYQSL